jgi:hypothetical protein
LFLLLLSTNPYFIWIFWSRGSPSFKQIHLNPFENFQIIRRWHCCLRPGPFSFFLFPRASPPVIFPLIGPPPRSRRSPAPALLNPAPPRPGPATDWTPPPPAPPHAAWPQLTVRPPFNSRPPLALSAQPETESTTPEVSHRLPLHPLLPARPPPPSERCPSPGIWPHRWRHPLS